MLLVVDMQQRFVPMAESILEEVNQTIDTCRQLGAPVIFTMQGHLWPEAPEAEDEKTSALFRWYGAQRSIK